MKRSSSRPQASHKRRLAIFHIILFLEEEDSAELASALGHIAKARGMTEIAKASGIQRESLYKALRPNSQPRFETICSQSMKSVSGGRHSSRLLKRDIGRVRIHFYAQFLGYAHGFRIDHGGDNDHAVSTALVSFLIKSNFPLKGVHSGFVHR